MKYRKVQSVGHIVVCIQEGLGSNYCMLDHIVLCIHEGLGFHYVYYVVTQKACINRFISSLPSSYVIINTPPIIILFSFESILRKSYAILFKF